MWVGSCKKDLIAISAWFCPPLCTYPAHISSPCCVRFFSQQCAQEICHMVLLFLGKWARLKEDTVGAFPLRNCKSSAQLTQLLLQTLRLPKQALLKNVRIIYWPNASSSLRAVWNDKWYLAENQVYRVGETVRDCWLSHIFSAIARISQW